MYNYQGGWVNQSGASTSPTATSFQFDNYTGNSPLFFVSDMAVLLPLTWTAFDLRKVSDRVKLTWETQNEINTKDFTVMRSNGNTDWTSIGTLPSLANVLPVKNYSFLDNEPMDGVNNYRIRQSDKDGKYSFSEIRTITLESLQKLRVINPVVNGKMIITLVRPAEITLVDASGRKIWTKRFASGTHQSDVSGLTKGIYYLKSAEASARVYIP